MKFLIACVVNSKDHCIKQPTQKATLAQRQSLLSIRTHITVWGENVGADKTMNMLCFCHEFD